MGRADELENAARLFRRLAGQFFVLQEQGVPVNDQFGACQQRGDGGRHF